LNRPVPELKSDKKGEEGIGKVLWVWLVERPGKRLGSRRVIDKFGKTGLKGKLKVGTQRERQENERKQSRSTSGQSSRTEHKAWGKTGGGGIGFGVGTAKKGEKIKGEKKKTPPRSIKEKDKILCTGPKK